MLNWRDLWHPAAGGAELFTMRVLERMARRGWSVEWFSSAYPGAAAEEMRDGIRFVRAGSQMTTHFSAFLRYRSKRSDFDVVIDQVNTIPFYASQYFTSPTIALFHQLAQEVWRYEKGPLIGSLGAALEPVYLRPYRGVPLVTISKSSARSLRDIGLKGPLRIIDMAVDEPCDDVVSEKSPSRDVLVIARLTASKRVDHAIRAASIMMERGWLGKLFIIGKPKGTRYGALLHRLASELLPGRCEFIDSASAGSVGSVNEVRAGLLRSASVVWYTSVREGWGLVVTEANCHGTPGVVYRIPGVIDAVQDGVTGLVCDPSPAALAEKTLELFGDGYDAYAEAALKDASWRNWDTTAQQFEAAIRELAAGKATRLDSVDRIGDRKSYRPSQPADEGN
jgi:glycosyltransferase involved in cell wall biosynthesis